MDPVLEAKGISKQFGSFYALQDVGFSVYPGEVNVLIGENGAGKSTLMKILSGVYAKDAGEIFLDGERVEIQSPVKAAALGIGTVYQELTLAPQLSVAENLYLGSDLVTNHLGIVDWKFLYKQSGETLRELVGMDVDTRQKVSELGIAQQQMVEIARVVSRNTKILILDEPTAVLTSREVEKLFEIITGLKKQGIAIIYISHRLEEIFRMGDRVTVLRDGKFVGAELVKDIDTDKLISMMVGRSLENQFPRGDFSDIEKKEVLRVENLSRGNAVKEVSFTVSTGEILGFAGLVGAGRTEVARLIFGVDTKDSGDIYIRGKNVQIRSTQEAIRQGIALLPEDRKGQGLVLKRSVSENTTMINLKKICSPLGIISYKKENHAVRDVVKQLRIAVTDVKNPVSSLSGGNQQKVVIAKWMFGSADIVIFDEPTRGIDVGAKTEVYQVMNEMVRQGKAVIMISSEMPELIGMCTRVITMREGRITGEFDNEVPASQEELLAAMMMG